MRQGVVYRKGVKTVLVMGEAGQCSSYLSDCGFSRCWKLFEDPSSYYYISYIQFIFSDFFFATISNNISNEC